MAESDFIAVEIDDIKDSNIILRNDFGVSSKIGEEKRRERKDITTHIIAITIILFFLFIVFISMMYNKIVPDYLLSIVSMVVGFYFAKEWISK
jgi:hypothetical protein